jgi:SAM-dependent methyltransferase
VTPPGKAQGWESIWADVEALPEYWRVPEPAILAWAERLRQAGGRRVLDLGCGIGRHTVALARLGFEVAATDVAPSGLVTCAAWLAREGLRAVVARQEMETFPFPDRAFNGLVAFHAIYHNTLAGMRRTLAEVQRILRPGAWLYLTAIPRDEGRITTYQAEIAAGQCREIEPFTFVWPHETGDKSLPHHLCDEAELRDLLAGFAVDNLSLVRRKYIDDDGKSQVSAHYHVQARRL